MRILADENFPKPIVELLRAEGHDVRWARSEFPGWKDAALLDLAESESRIVLTLDNDYWQLASQRRVPIRRSGVILFRVHPATDTNLKPLIRVLSGDVAWAGHISIVTARGIQMMASRKTD